ncbi:MAG: metallophosphoesterase, partial [Deltaproteobacteria bacterium]|nr:metallophosphoesterase [Deltaproteobacteria bacterium]
MPSPALVAQLFEGPLDIVGDVHGELDVLHDLMERLGYDRAGNHPDKRRLVFLGDLCDRGPDSPG